MATVVGTSIPTSYDQCLAGKYPSWKPQALDLGPIFPSIGAAEVADSLALYVNPNSHRIMRVVVFWYQGCFAMASNTLARPAACDPLNIALVRGFPNNVQSIRAGGRQLAKDCTE
ncbi:hypothetical protein C8J98_10877 [Luteibacter sp. OK325]|nr:hypothetical protein C8J98_10877 [Luteibacter sp. OK325]